MTQNSEIPEGMLEFDLDLALKGWPVCTREKKEVRISFIVEDRCFCILGWHFCPDSTWESNFWNKEGRNVDEIEDSALDLFLKKKTRTQWAVVYHTKDGMTGSFCVDEEQAKAYAKANRELFPQIVSFELDEPEPQKKTKTYWVNVYGADGNKSISCNCVPYQSEADAINNRVTAPGVKCLKTISFNLDEPEKKPKTKTLWIAISKRKCDPGMHPLSHGGFEDKKELMNIFKHNTQKLEESHWIKLVEVEIE